MDMQYTFDEDLFSDLHKDAYGMRPGPSFYEDLKSMTNEQKQGLWDRLMFVSRDRADEEHREHLRAEAALERKISLMSATSGTTREDAIRYLHDLHNTNGDREYLEYCLGVRYGYLAGAVYVGF